MGNPTSIKRRFIMFYFKDDSQITVYFADGNSAVWKSDNPQFEKVAHMCENNQWIPIQMLHNQAKTLLCASSPPLPFTLLMPVMSNTFTQTGKTMLTFSIASPASLVVRIN